MPVTGKARVPKDWWPATCTTERAPRRLALPAQGRIRRAPAGRDVPQQVLHRRDVVRRKLVWMARLQRMQRVRDVPQLRLALPVPFSLHSVRHMLERSNGRHRQAI